MNKITANYTHDRGDTFNYIYDNLSAAIERINRLYKRNPRIWKGFWRLHNEEGQIARVECSGGKVKVFWIQGGMLGCVNSSTI